jgi:hypothetical protein
MFDLSKQTAVSEWCAAGRQDGGSIGGSLRLLLKEAMKTQMWRVSYLLGERTENRHGVFFRNKVFLPLSTEMALLDAKRS